MKIFNKQMITVFQLKATKLFIVIAFSSIGFLAMGKAQSVLAGPCLHSINNQNQVFDCCNNSEASSQTYNPPNGYCSRSCGGGICYYDSGSGNWQSTTCNTQSCTPTSPPQPTSTPSPQPTATPLPQPTVTPSPQPTVTPTSIPPSPTITLTSPTSTPVPTATPGGPTLTPVPTVTPGGPSLTPFPTNIPGVCPLKRKGDANCDGKVDEGDYKLWLQEFDTMISASPVNQNANYACVEGNPQTYFVDLSDFEVWRRNTTSGLVSFTPSQPIGPTQTPGGSGTSCVNTSNCATGFCCAQGANTCQSTNTAGIACLSGTSGTQVTPAPTSSSQSNQSGSGNNDKTHPGDNTGADKAAQAKLDRLNELEHLKAKDPGKFTGSDSEIIYNGLKNEFGINDSDPNNDLVKSDKNTNGDGIDYSWK